MRRPRVRTADDEAEAPLSSYEAAKAADLLGEHLVGAMLAGLSTRRYPAALEPVGEQTDEQAKATSKSSMSRAFVAATAERLEQLLSAPLDDERWVIVYVDGFTFGEHQLVAALGVTFDRRKVPRQVSIGCTSWSTTSSRSSSPTSSWPHSGIATPADRRSTLGELCFSRGLLRRGVMSWKACDVDGGRRAGDVGVGGTAAGVGRSGGRVLRRPAG